MVEPIVEPFLNTITLSAKYNWYRIFVVGAIRRTGILTQFQNLSPKPGVTK